jgi:hypothetical protein
LSGVARKSYPQAAQWPGFRRRHLAVQSQIAGITAKNATIAQYGAPSSKTPYWKSLSVLGSSGPGLEVLA